MKLIARLVLLIRLLWLGYDLEEAEHELELIESEERRAQLHVVEGGGS